MGDPIGDAVREVTARVAAAAGRVGRDPSEVRIVAAVKSVPVERIEHALAAGVTELGENRAKDLAAKAECLGPEVTWHFLGSIQTNKVALLDRAALIHGLDRAREAEALHSRGRGREVLIEVNVAGETSKQGIAERQVDGLLESLGAYPLVRPRGFMFVAPQAQNPEDVRWVFARGRQLRERYSSHGLYELSMGMSDDYEVAIEEGATIVRIGRAIFGSRGT